MKFRLEPAQQARLLTAAVTRLMATVRAGGGEARIVGGAVRDVMLDRASGDIDLATTLPPQTMMDLLPRAGIKAVGTGLAHGTVTAVIDHVGYEITTLRRDVETDGRHAQVAFTDDWRADAERRDFTMNALYLDADGTVYDYFNGAEDARAGLVRFIGAARDRIGEDVLRIMRYFRFLAWYGRGEPNAEALTACRELSPTMSRLSAERVARETLKLLAAPNPLAAWRLMQDVGATQAFLAEATKLDRLQSLLQQERATKAAAEPLLRLAALLPEDATIAATLAARLKLSRRDAELLTTLVRVPTLLRDRLAPPALRQTLYRTGPDAVRLGLLLLNGDLTDALTTIKNWENPRFAVQGEDLLKLGLTPGPRIGETLRNIEDWWIAGDFTADRAACVAYAQKLIAGKNH